MKISTHSLVIGAAIGSTYAVMTWLSGIFLPAIGPIEFRLSEALCILPLFFPQSIAGLTAGCAVGSIFIGAMPQDIIFGSLATLLGALGTRALRRRPYLAMLCPVLSNTLIVPPILYFVYGFSDVALPLIYLFFFLGEAASVYFAGTALKKGLEKVLPYLPKR